jgi:hypothetical protein
MTDDRTRVWGRRRAVASPLPHPRLVRRTRPSLHALVDDAFAQLVPRVQPAANEFNDEEVSTTLRRLRIG